YEFPCRECHKQDYIRAMCGKERILYTEERVRFEEIEVVLGSMAKLPCDLVPPEDDDSVALVIWYKDDDKTPIYRYVLVA
ncbi:hypothetical protein J6590_104037, partial [Homalodisca vitripennis]